MLASLGLTALLATLKGRLMAGFMPYLAIFIGAFVLVLGLAWGIHAIREDAKADVRAEFRAQQAEAQLEANRLAALRQRASEEVAARQRAELANELATLTQRARDLEEQLARRPRTLAYPKEIIPRLNQ